MGHKSENKLVDDILETGQMKASFQLGESNHTSQEFIIVYV